MDIITIAIAVVGITIIALFVKWYITIYNKFVYWKTRAERKFADVEVIMEQLVEMNQEITNVVKNYDLHEYKTLKDVIEARSRWSKDIELNQKVAAAQQVEADFLKIQAVLERYPNLKADVLHKHLLGRANVSEMYYKLSHAKREYNRVVQEYNKRVRQFPRCIVARISGFKPLNYFETVRTKFKEQKEYNPKGGFE